MSRDELFENAIRVAKQGFKPGNGHIAAARAICAELKVIRAKGGIKAFGDKHDYAALLRFTHIALRSSEEGKKDCC